MAGEITRLVQRQVEEEEEEEELVQAKPTPAQTPQAYPTLATDIRALRGNGQPLDPATRAFMEPRFGHDFSQVRVHTGTRVANSAKAINARAFTLGKDMFFGAGQFAPDSNSGKQLLAHELTHIVQQSKPEKTTRSQRQQATEANGNHQITETQTLASGAVGIMREIISANPSPSGGGGKPPSGLTGCHVFLGGRRIDHWLAGTLGFRHLYIDVYEGPSDYALIEAGPVGSTTGGTSGAWVKNSDWDARGIQFDITPEENCPAFVNCLKRETANYHAAGHPYHYSNGPNSNSFAWWVLNQCGLSITPLVSSYPYLGVDYWQTHSSTSTTPSPVPTGD